MLRFDQISWICTTQESITCFGIGETVAVMAAAAADAAATAAASAATFIGSALVGTAATTAGIAGATATAAATAGFIGAAGAVTFGGVVQAGIAGLSVASSIMAATSASNEGDAAEQEAAYKATLANQDANNAAATGERNMIAQDKQNALNESNAVGAAAGSGTAGSESEFTNLGIINDQGQYKAMTAMYDGASRAQAFGNSAAADIFQGQVTNAADQSKATTDLINGGVSLFSRYGSAPSTVANTATVNSPTTGN